MTKLKSINDQIKYYYILTTIAILVKGSISPPNISANSTLRLVTASKWYFTIPECLNRSLCCTHLPAQLMIPFLFISQLLPLLQISKQFLASLCYLQKALHFAAFLIRIKHASRILSHFQPIHVRAQSAVTVPPANSRFLIIGAVFRRKI